MRAPWSTVVVVLFIQVLQALGSPPRNATVKRSTACPGVTGSACLFSTTCDAVTTPWDPMTKLTPTIRADSTYGVYAGKDIVALTWTISWKRMKIDGLPCRDVLLVNDVWPPPKVVVDQGTPVLITLINKDVEEGVSLHAHGLYQKNSQHQDGAVGLTQKAVKPGEMQLYEWSTNDQTGTYWIHSHVRAQYPHGLRMPFIIKDATDAWPAVKVGNTQVTWTSGTDPDVTFALNDWVNRYPCDIDRIYLTNVCKLSNGNLGGIDIQPDEMMVNDRWLRTLIPDPVIDLSGKLVTRLRLINMSSYTTMYLWLAGSRQMRVIELDGVKMDGTRSFRVIELHAGQRISVLVYSGSDTQAQNTRLRIEMDTSFQGPMEDIMTDSKNPKECWPQTKPDVTSIADMKSRRFWLDTVLKFGPQSTTPIDDGTPALATFQTGSRKLCWDTFFPGRCAAGLGADFEDLLLAPQSVQPGTWVPPDSASWRSVKVIDNTEPISSDCSGRGQMSVSGRPYHFYVAPTYPTLTLPADRPDLDWSKEVLAGKIEENSNTITIPDSQTKFWFVIQSLRGDHPFHLHGHHFQVLYRSRRQDSAEVLDSNLSKYTLSSTDQDKLAGKWSNAANPVRRDTLMVYKNGLAIIAIDADNPGAWFLHCHNDYHMQTGMAAQVIEHPTGIKDWFAGLSTRQMWSMARALGVLPMCPSDPNLANQPPYDAYCTKQAWFFDT